MHEESTHSNSCVRDEDAPTVLRHAHFRLIGVCGHLLTAGSFAFRCPNPVRQKGMQMKLKIRYENEMQTIELDNAAAEQLWVGLSLEDGDIPQEEKERLLQDAFDMKFNRPDYNSWHKFERHRGYSTAQPGKDEEEEDMDIMAFHADPSIPGTIDEWLEQFEMFSIYEVLPEILQLWGTNLVTDAESKKNMSGQRGR